MDASETGYKPRIFFSEWENEYGCYYNTEPKPVDWVIGDTLERGTIGLLYSPPECGKGFFSLQLAIELAFGNPPFGIPGWAPSRPIRTAFISNEDSRNTVHRRIKSIVRHKHACCEPTTGIEDMAYFYPRDGLDALFDRRDGEIACSDFYWDVVRLLKYHAEDGLPFDLVVLDNLSSFFGPIHDQSDELPFAFRQLSQICDRFGLSILLLHHSRKQDSTLKNVKLLHQFYDQQLSQDSARGSSKLLASVRSAICMAPFSRAYSDMLELPDAMDYPNGKYVGMRVAKNSNGPPQDDYIFCREPDGVLTKMPHRREMPKREPRGDQEAAKLAKDVENAKIFCDYARAGFDVGISYYKTDIIKNTVNCNRGKGGPADRAFQLLVDQGCVEITRDLTNRERVRFIKSFIEDA
ncbi:MAG: AAA family ATPase [Deltaproteobacteria bacterium]|jgi:hypothetical protein|nr:AAA family ATPase [Deltaproteobacteria bacterium]